MLCGIRVKGQKYRAGESEEVEKNNQDQYKAKDHASGSGKNWDKDPGGSETQLQSFVCTFFIFILFLTIYYFEF